MSTTMIKTGIKVSSKKLVDIEAKIRLTFNDLRESVNRREKALLDEVKHLQYMYEQNQVEQMENLAALERAKSDLSEIRNNALLDVREKSLQPLIDKMKELEEKPYYHTRLECNLIDIKQDISKLGMIVESIEPEYSKMLRPKKDIGKGLKVVGGVAFSEIDKRIYIVDVSSHKIHVYSAIDEKYITEFGKERLKEPWSIIANDDNIYVSDNANYNITKFKYSNISGYQLENVANLTATKVQHSELATIAIDIDIVNKEVYATDSYNNRVVVHSPEFIVKKMFGKNLLQPMAIKIFDIHVYVIDNGKTSMHVFGKDGSMIKSVIMLDQSNNLIQRTHFFTIDPQGKFIISDGYNKRVLLIGNEGNYIDTLAKFGDEGSKLTKGIALTDGGDIITAYDCYRCTANIW